MLITDELLLNYKRCRRRTYLEVYGNPAQKDPDKEFLLKLKRENHQHIRSVLQARAQICQRPQVSRQNWQLNAQQTLELMQQGVECLDSRYTCRFESTMAIFIKFIVTAGI